MEIPISRIFAKRVLPATIASSVLASIVSLLFRTYGPSALGIFPTYMGFPFQYLTYYSVPSFLTSTQSHYSFQISTFLLDIGFYFSMAFLMEFALVLRPLRVSAYAASFATLVTFASLLVKTVSQPELNYYETGLPFPYLTVSYFSHSIPGITTYTFYYPNVGMGIVDWMIWMALIFAALSVFNKVKAVSNSIQAS